MIGSVLLFLSISGIGKSYGNEEPFVYSKLNLPADFSFNNVHRVATDEAGFIWIFELQGRIYRFDGNDAVPAQRLFGADMPNHMVKQAVVADTTIWWCDDQVMSIANLSTLEVRSHPLPFGGYASGIGVSFLYAHGSQCYIATDRGQLYLMQKSGSIRLLVDFAEATASRVFLPSITHMAEWNGVIYLMVSKNGMYRYTPEEGVLPVDLSAYTGNDARCEWMQRIGDRLFVSGQFDGFIRMAGDTIEQVLATAVPADASAQYFPLTETQFVQFLPDESRLWSIHDDRLVLRETINENNTHFSPIYDKSGVFFKNQQGLYRLTPPRAGAFGKNDLFRSINSARYSIRHIFSNGGDIYVGTYPTLYQLGGGQYEDRPLLEKIVYTSTEDAQGNTWLGIEGDGVAMLDSEGRIHPVLTADDPINPYVTALAFAGRDTLLIGTYEGLYAYDTGAKKLAKLPIYEDVVGVQSTKISKILPVDGRVYLATEKGFYWVDRLDTLQFRQLPGFATRDPVYDFQLEYPVLWLAPRDEGVVRYDMAADTVRRFDTQHGLASNTVFSLLRVGTHLVCGTARGLSIMDLDGFSVRSFYKEDGLPDNEFNMGAKWTDGRLIGMGTVAGAVAFTLPDLASDSRQANFSPLVSWLTINNESTGAYREQFTLPGIALRQVELDAAERLVVINFNTLARRPSQPLYYKVRHQQAWLPVNGSNLILTGLLPGENTVLFSMDQQEVSGRLDLHVVPYYYESWWFKLLVMGTVGLLLWGYIRYRIQRQQAELALRTQISSDLHDEVGGVLTGIALQADYLLYTGEKRAGNGGLLEKMASASREAVSAMDDVVWSVDSRNDHWGSLVGRMRNCATTLCDASGIRLHFHTQGIDAQDKIPVYIRQNIFLIFKEAVNNCCKHSAARNLSVEIAFGANNLSMVLADDGKGCDGLEGEGQGMRNMRMRAERLHADLQFSTPHTGNGLVITLSLHIRKATPMGRGKPN